MAEFDDEDDTHAYLSEDDKILYSHKGYGGHSGGSRGYELPRRSETYSVNPGNRRSREERFHRTMSCDLDEDFDSRLQHSRRDGADLSNRGNGRFGREAPHRYAAYQPEEDYDGEGYEQGYSLYNERYPPDTGYGPRSHTLSENFPSNSDVKIVHKTNYNIYLWDDGDCQKERSDRKEREGFTDTPPPPGEKSGKLWKNVKKGGKVVLPMFVSGAIQYGFDHL